MKRSSYSWARWSALTLSLAAALVLLMLSGQALAQPNCPNEALRNGPSAGLPDCRAYELVSPVDKNGGGVDGGLKFESEQPPWQASPDGEAITYPSQTTFTEADPLSSMATTQYFATRGLDGWTSKAIMPIQKYPNERADIGPENIDESLYQGFSEDLSTGFLTANEPPLVSGAPPGYYDPYIRDNATGNYQLLSTVTPPVQPPGYKFKEQYAGMSTDHRHVIFAANDALTPNAVPGETNLYEWSDGQLELVSVLPDGKPIEVGQSVVLDPAGFGFGGPSQIGEQGVWSNFSHAISADGSRVFWSGNEYPNPHQNSEKVGMQVYMRERTSSSTRVVKVSASQKVGGDVQEAAHYWTASTDGSLVYFTSCARLTDDATAGENEAACGEFTGATGVQGQDLYQYNANTEHLTDLTVDSNPGGTANVKGVLGASDDGSYVYFVAYGVLATGATAGGEAANLYVWHDGATTWIATLSLPFQETHDGSDWDQGVTARTSRVTPDGRHLAFQSDVDLTGYDTYSLDPEACTHYPYYGPRCKEVYEYSADTKSLVCASCNPTGLPPVGNSIVPLVLHSEISGPVTGWQSSTLQQRYLSDDGSRLFFVSEDVLLPLASNGRENVYEHEQDGSGRCHTPSGCLYLISTGTSGDDSFFAEASRDGGNVFIVSRQQLVPGDGDEARDLYDVRVEGGFSVPLAPPCAGEACRAPASPAPSIYGAPPSATFVGAGNPTSGPPAHSVLRKKANKRLKCAKGRKLSRGKCVKAKVKSKSKAKKSGNGHRRVK
jgi:hypothetical protein